VTRGRTRPGSRQETRTIRTARPLGGDLATQRSLLGNVDGRSGERVLTGLQRTYGNAAVSNLLQPVAQREPAPAATSAPAEVKWNRHFDRGGLGGSRTLGQDGQHTLFRGDVLVVTATGSSGGAAPTAEVEQTYEGRTSRTTVPGSVLGASVEWRFELPTVGSYSVTFAGVGTTHTEHVNVVTDFNDFLASCQQAHTLIDQKYNAAIARMTRASEAYDAAWKDQQKDLTALHRQEQIAGEIITGLIFAGVGGLAGGWIGDVAKGLKLSGPVTDGGKDLTKYLARTAPRLTGPSGSMPVTPGDSVDRTSGLDVSSAPSGRDAAAGVDPMTAMTRLMRALLSEKDHLLDQLDKTIDAARTGRASHGVEAFGDDPRTVVAQDHRLETAMAAIEIDEKFYLQTLWHAWLEEYSWVVVELADVGGTVYSPRSTIDDPWPINWARKALAAAAVKCGETIELWETNYIGPARDAAKQKAATEQAEHPHYQIGIPP
jgi:hypothetical protein